MAQQVTDLATVINVLAGLEGLPAETTKMLVEGLPHAVRDPQHAYQTTFAVMVRKALVAGLGGTEEQEAEEVAKAALKEAEAKDAAFHQARAATSKADGQHKRAKREGESAGKQREKLRKDLDHAKAVSEGALRMLAAGGCEDAASKEAAAQAVSKYLAEVGAEATILTSAAHALVVPPLARQTFDKVTVEAVQGVVGRALDELQAKVKEGEPAERQAHAELLGFWAIADRARERQEQAEKEAEAAKKRLEAAQETEVKVRALSDGLRALERLVENKYAEETDGGAPMDVDAAAKSPVDRRPLYVPTPHRT